MSLQCSSTEGAKKNLCIYTTWISSWFFYLEFAVQVGDLADHCILFLITLSLALCS